MTSSPTQRRNEQWLLELTGIPTAAGHEDRVVAWVRDWVKKRRRLRMKPDRSGNLVITSTTKSEARPLFVTAHLDHPAFVVVGVPAANRVVVEFRGGVQDPYFQDAAIELFDTGDRSHRATIVSRQRKKTLFKRYTARLHRPGKTLQIGDIGRWALRGRGRVPVIDQGRLYAPACDDLAGVAAALSALDVLSRRRGMGHVGVLLTVAEEIGFIGTIGACVHRTLPRSARLICLENSRSFPDSPIGGGPIVRVGDRMSVFSPELTNRIGLLLLEQQGRHPDLRFQRKLMPGGTCEATAFASFGYESTCLCLPLGNYHNMRNIDAVQAGRRPARVGAEFISIDDYHGLIEMVITTATHLDRTKTPVRNKMEALWEERAFVVENGRTP